MSPEPAKEHASCLSPDPACVDTGRDPVRCDRRSLARNRHRSSPLPRATYCAPGVTAHWGLGTPQPGKSPLPVCGSLALTTPWLASQHRCHFGAGCLVAGPGRPGCVSPCCVQCRRYSARNTSRGNMDQSREPTKAVHASADRRQSSQCPPSCLLRAGLSLRSVSQAEPGYWSGFCCA